jgi:ATP-binding cassette subfamily F protein uup
VSDWLIQTKRANEINAAQGKTTAKPFNYEREQLQKQEQATAAVSASAPVAPAPAKAKKLSFKEQRELDGLPDQIAALEAEQSEINDALADGSLYSIDNVRALKLATRNAQIDDELMTALERWEVLGKPA